MIKNRIYLCLKAVSPSIIALALLLVFSAVQTEAGTVIINGEPYSLDQHGLIFNSDNSISLQMSETGFTGQISGYIDLKNSDIFLKAAGLQNGVAKHTVADRYGRFNFRNLPDGTFDVFPHMYGYTFYPSAYRVDIRGNTTTIIDGDSLSPALPEGQVVPNISFTSSKQATLFGSVEGFGGPVTVNVFDTQTNRLVASTTVSDGSPYFITGLTKGKSYSVEAGLSGQPATQTKTIASFDGENSSTSTAVFQNVIQYSLNLSSSQSGATLTKSPNKAQYDAGETVTITASAQVTVGTTTYLFNGWSGSYTGSTSPAVITMDSNKSIVANYAVYNPTLFTLTLASSPSGASVTKSPDKSQYNNGEAVTISAPSSVTINSQQYLFSYWSGDLTGSANPASVTMNANKTITANYQVQGTVDTPACSTSGGSSASSPKCITPNAATFTYIESLTPGQVRYYMVRPPAGTTVMTVEYVSRDQLADCNIFVQEGSIKNIVPHMDSVVALGTYNKLIKQTLDGVPVYAFLSRQTSENVPITPVQQVNYYFTVKNVSTTNNASIILYSTTR